MQLDIWKPTDTDTLLERAAKRKGIRAADLMAAISSIKEMNRQRPQFSRPSILIESAEVVFENRASAKDMALYEALLAIAKDGGMENAHHSIKAEMLMDFLQTDSVERLIDALIRVASTMVEYDVRDVAKRKRYTGAVPLIGFEIESDLPKNMKQQLKGLIDRGSSILHFKIPPVVREVFLQPKPYTWVSLHAISQFKCKYTNGIYQLLAVKAGHDDGYIRPLEIDAQKLAIKIGWSHARRKPFNAALFLKRCVEPALEDIGICVNEFCAYLKPLERDTSKRGAPLKPLIFDVRRKHNFELSGVDLLARKKLRTKSSLQTDVTMPDHIHPPEYLPSLAAVTRAAQVLRKPNFYDRSDIAKENRNRPRQLALHWRTVLDAITADPDRMVSHHLCGHDIFAALDDPKRVGVDRIFEHWAINTPRDIHRMGVPARHDIRPPSAKNRPVPTDGVLRHSIYGLIASIERVAKDLSSPYASKLPVSVSNLAESLIATPGVWEAIKAAAALQGVNLGGLTKAMGMISKAHPVRMRWTAKNVCLAVFDHDWRKIERIMKATFAQKDNLNRSPINGKLMSRRQDVDAPLRARRDEDSGEIVPYFH